MASKSTRVSSTHKQRFLTQSSLREKVWKPLKDEIKRLVDTLIELDNDKTKSVDITAEYTERIKKAVPSTPIAIGYPNPIHQILSVHQLQRIEIPLVVLEVLVSFGFDVNEYISYEHEYSNSRLTCLHLSIKNYHYNASRWLVQHGADCNKTSYDRAISTSNIAPISVLAAHQDAPMDLIDLLITQENINGNPHRNTALPLHVAVQHGQANIAMHLIEHGANVSEEGRNQSLPLHFAVREGHTELALSVIKHGASVNQKDRFGHLPLSLALEVGHTELARLLITNGASVNKGNGNYGFGELPIFHAMSKGYTDLALLMITHGASVNQKDKYGTLPLHFCVKKGHTDLALSMIEHGASVTQKDSHGDLPLHSAVREGHTNLALSLIEHGAPVNRKDTSGDFPLHVAVTKDHTDVVLLLIKHGASLNQQNWYGDPPLHVAVRKGHTNLALSLIEHGASVNLQNKGGEMPIAHYFSNDKEQLNDQLFTRLIPGSSANILKLICNVVETSTERNPKLLSWGLRRLIQHLIFMGPLKFVVEVRHEWDYMWVARFILKLNNKVLIFARESLKAAYLCSVLLVLSSWDVSFPNAIVPQLSDSLRAEYLSGAQSIDDLWHMYKQNDKVKRLHTLCVQNTRKCMHSFTDENFQSLPVPNYLRKLLMLHDVADVLCEAYQMWPKCIPIEDFM